MAIAWRTSCVRRQLRGICARPASTMRSASRSQKAAEIIAAQNIAP